MSEATPGDIGPLPAARLKSDPSTLVKSIGQLTPTVVALRARGILDKIEPDIKVDAEALKTDKMFPVQLLTEYRPLSTRFQFGEVDPDTGEITYTDPPEVVPGQDAGFIHRIEAGEYAMLPRSEALQLFKHGIAVRNDELAA